jgi:hypothetical protein
MWQMGFQQQQQQQQVEEVDKDCIGNKACHGSNP